MKNRHLFLSIFYISFFAVFLLLPRVSFADLLRIQVDSENPRYWNYNGERVILLGGTDDDNLFQWPNCEEQLDLLASAGGNYIRNTMSDRKDKGFEVYPFKQLENGKYDLNQWNDEYWKRFEKMLNAASERGVIVQIEVWDRFDYSDSKNNFRWKIHPYNPKNNINYSYEKTGFKTEYLDHPNNNKQHFFYSIPGMETYKKKYDIFRQYQEAFVEKMLSYSLNYGNVLYCMNNETSAPPKWGQYWIKFIKDRAKKKNVHIEITDMWDNWDIKKHPHHVTYDNPGIYSFIDVSQNNHNKKQQHWDNIQWVRNKISGAIRPMNTVKIYGADTGRYGNHRDAQERFWRNIFGGIAATRFHRPDSGLGLNEIAQSHIKSMRMVLDTVDVTQCTPDSKSELLSNREPNEAYLTYNKGKAYALFFPNGGSVDLDLKNLSGTFNLQKLDILKNEWTDTATLKAEKQVTIETPGGYWAVVLYKE